MMEWHLPAGGGGCTSLPPRGVAAQPPASRGETASRGIWQPTQELSLVFPQKVYFLCGRVWWIFLISLFSVLDSKHHIPFQSLQCFINNKITSLCLSCKYLDSGSYVYFSNRRIPFSLRTNSRGLEKKRSLEFECWLSRIFTVRPRQIAWILWVPWYRSHAFCLLSSTLSLVQSFSRLMAVTWSPPRCL